ncbi:MAG: geranylgeranyl reductase family protein [Thermodesulfobacteriota bacterium]
MGHDYDVIVVGAGPGGATSARLCAEAGLKTLLIEKERIPRYKPCGGCLSLKTVRLLGFDLSPVLENTVYGVKFSYCFEDSFSIQSTEPMAFLVMRDRFDQFLVEKALRTGAEVLEGERVARVKEKDSWVEVELSRGKGLRCEYLIGADGAESIVAKSLSLLPKKVNRTGIGVESEIPFGSTVNFPREDIPRIHLDFGRFPSGFGWVFPKREGISVGMGGMFFDEEKNNLRRCFADFVKGLSYIKKGEETRALGHFLPAFYEESQRVSRGRVLLVGDAGYLIDPLTGEGIYYAIRSGALAAGSILQSKEKGPLPGDRYQEAVRVDIFENLKWALFFARFVNRFNKLSYQTLRHYPELGNLYLQVLEGRETYKGFVDKVKQRVKNFLKGRLSDKIKKAIAAF